MEKTVVLWENDIIWLEKMEKNLKKQGMEYKEAETYTDLLEILKEKEEYIVLLAMDVLKEAGGEQWKEKLHKICHNHYGIFCVLGESLSYEYDVIQAGAADYFLKEKGSDLLGMKIKQWSRWTRSQQSVSKKQGSVYMVVEEKRQFMQDGYTVCFSPLEFQVFQMLRKCEGNFCTREAIFEKVWAHRRVKSNRVVDTTVKQIRCKLQDTNYTIFGEYKKGYRFGCRKLSVDK